MDTYRDIPLIYNLFPRLAGTFDHWLQHVHRAAEMGFNWIFINSIHYPGFSGSLYSIKDYYRINPDFLPTGDTTDELKSLETTVRRIHDAGLYPIMDLIINHTAIDSPLLEEHPEWYIHNEDGTVRSPFAIDPDDSQKVTVWGDLAEIDNSSSKDRDTLWNYWRDLVKRYLDLGFKGFRCDASYKVPSELWNYLIDETRAIDAESVFFAETLGCTEEEALALHDAGFHYFFNSSKWWDFTQPWCLEQHEKFGKIAPSISFPESHDTARLSADTSGNESIQKQRYAFAAIFSAGVIMPIGYEFGFRNRLDVVSTRPTDWETPSFDLRDYIKRVNRLKVEKSVLQSEGHFTISINNSDVLVLQRTIDREPAEKSWIAVNKHHSQPSRIDLTIFLTNTIRYKAYRTSVNEETLVDISLPDSPLWLEPAELVVILEP